jgi:tetratricopeptide (TPR) repeat protein
MRKRINYRFALYLILTVAALGIGTHFLHAYQVGRNSSSLLVRAQQYREQGELSKAADSMGQYLGLNPKDFKSLAEYGLLLADDQLAKTPQSKYRAVMALERALVRDPERQDVRRRAAEVAMAIGYFSAARDHLDNLCKALPKHPVYKDLPNDPEVVLMFARCLDALSDVKGARGKFESAIKMAPHNLDAYTRLATLLRRKTADVLIAKETEADVVNRANNVVDTMVDANPASYRAYLLRAEYRRTFAGADRPNPEGWAGDVAEAERLAPDVADVLLASAELGLAQSDVFLKDGKKELAQNAAAKSREQFLRCGELHPRDWRSYQGLARLEAKQGKTDDAIAWLNRGLEQIPKSMELHWERAQRLVAADRGADAQLSIKALSDSGFPEADLDVLRGRILMRTEDWVDAIERLKVAYDPLITRADRLKDDEAALWAERAGLWLGECYQQIGNVSRAHTVYGRVVARNSQSIPGRIGVATTLWAQGRLKDALDQYRVLTRFPDYPPGVLVNIARLALLVNLEREESRRNWDEVDDALKQAERLKPLPVSVAILRADYRANQDKTDNARFDNAGRYLAEMFPDQKARPAEVWVALSALEEQRGQPAKALAILDEAEQLVGDRVELRLARAGYLVRQGQGKARDALLALAKDIDDEDEFSIADRRRLLRGLADAFTQAKLTAEASDLWQRLATELPGDIQSRLALFDLAANADDKARWQDEIHAIEGDDGVMWRQVQISSLLAAAQGGKLAVPDEAKTLLQAKTLLRAMAARQPDSPSVPLIGARIGDLEKRPDEALPLYMRAIDLGARDPAALARAFNLLIERGRVDEANRVARLLPKSTMSSLDAQRAIGEVALRANKLDRARELADEVVAAAPTDYRGYLLRGQTLSAQGELKDAENDFRKARDLASSEPTTWLTLVQFLVAIKRPDEALAEADQAQKLLSGPKGLLALARINSLVGRGDRAAELYRSSVAAGGDDPDVLGNAAIHYLTSGRQKEADDLLRRLSQSSDRKWSAQARYLRAVMVAGRGNPETLKEALALIESKGANPAELSAAEKIQQKRSHAQILALQPFKIKRREAAQILDGLIDQQLATPADHLLAAQLYDSVDDLAKARARYLALLTMPGGNSPAILASAGRFLVRHGDLDGAAMALSGLEKSRPQQPTTVKELRARMLHAQNRTSEAVDLLKEVAAMDGTDRSAVAGVLEEIGQFPEAEAQLRELVRLSRRPDDRLKLASYLVRRKRCPEALYECDRAWANCPPVAVAEICLTALAEMPPDPSAIGRVADRLEALSKSGDDLALLGALAAVRNFQGRFDDAEAIYRVILKKDSGQVTALNNLAWLLALKGGHADEAVALADRAAQLTGPNPDLLDTRAVAYLALNRPATADLAVKCLEQVIYESPSPTAYFHLAQAQLQAGKRKEAIEAWRKANVPPLNPENLHPLERTAFERIVEALGPPT